MSPLSRRTFLTGAMSAGGLLVASGLAGCSRDDTGSNGSAANQRSATYQLSWTHSVQFAGTYLAARNGYFGDAGLQVTLAAGGPNVAGDANTVSGAALVNISGADGVARSNEAGADLVIVGAQYQRAAGTILSLADNPLTTPQSLEGARIGVADVNTPVLAAFTQINNLDPGAIELIPTQYDPAALVAGQIDGIFCFYTDLPVSLQVQGIDGATMLLADYGYNPMSQVYTVLRENLQNDRRQDIIDLLRGDIRGWQDYEDAPDGVAELVVEEYPDAGLNLEAQQIQAELQPDLMFSELTTEQGFGWFTDEAIAANLELFDILEVQGDESLWDRSLLEEIFADGPRL